MRCDVIKYTPRACNFDPLRLGFARDLYHLFVYIELHVYAESEYAHPKCMHNRRRTHNSTCFWSPCIRALKIHVYYLKHASSTRVHKVRKLTWKDHFYTGCSTSAINPVLNNISGVVTKMVEFWFFFFHFFTTDKNTILKFV